LHAQLTQQHRQEEKYDGTANHHSRFVGNGPSGFLLLDEDFNVAGHWELKTDGMPYNYDFWYQPRHNVMVSGEFGAPHAYYGGFNLEDVAAGKYGRTRRT
jgi:hypothetical protein